MKRSLTLLLLALATTLTVRAEKVANMPKPTGYVDDYAGVMTTDGKAAVEAVCREIHEKAKAQIFLVTIKSLEGESIETFANDLFHTWKIGEKGTDRGILLLLSINDHKRRIEVGYGFEGILPDARAGRIGLDMVPALKDSDYDEAAKVGVTEIADLIAADAKVTLDAAATPLADADQPPPPVDAAPPTSEISGAKWLFVLFPFLAFFALFGFLVWRSIKRGVRFGGGGSSFGGSSDSSSFSDSSSSSSDDSFSGGDGGDSGGGGASGDW